MGDAWLDRSAEHLLKLSKQVGFVQFKVFTCDLWITLRRPSVSADSSKSKVFQTYSLTENNRAMPAIF